MILSRLSRPDGWDSRIDTPMREESRSAQGSTTSVSHPHGPLTPSSLLSTPHELTSEEQTITLKCKMPQGSPTSGFTAVNGESQRNTSFRPDDSLQRIKGDISEQHAGAQPVHSWRPHDQPTAQPDGLDSPQNNKRKRDECDKDVVTSNVREHQAIPAENELLKRRTVAADAPADTAYGTTAVLAPERIALPASSRSARERATPNPYEREESPKLRTDHGKPPGSPASEIVASLAESLKATIRETEQHDSPLAQNGQQQLPQGGQEGGQYAQSGQKSTSPTGESYDHEHSPPCESENGHHGYADDPAGKKRKRNFSNRTKTGCHTCRQRKKKCDERKPVCNNCTRGGFTCGGYGAKPPGGTKISAARNLAPSKAAYEPSHGPSQFSINPYYDNRARQPPPHPAHDPTGYGPHHPPRPEPHGLPPAQHYNHPPHMPPPMDYSRREPYFVHYPEAHHYGDRPPSHGPLPPLPPPQGEYGGLAPPYQHPPHPPHPPHSNHIQSPPGPPVPPPHSVPHPPLPPVLPGYSHVEQYHGRSAPPTSISSKESGVSSHSSGQRPRPGLVYRSGEKIARSKMITGEPCNYFTDRELIRERASCKEVLEHYNDADRTNSGVHIDQKGVIFSQLVNPKERPDYAHSWDGPIGSVGDRVVVQAPFSCEYGYNIHFGDEAMIMRNCHFQDAATISIGSKVTIGPGCSFLTLISPTESGPHGKHSAGAIKIEDGCTIGGNVTILPFRTIGKGATVLAGSVVTKDVKPGSKVVGNPAKLVRDDDEVVEKENAKVLKDMQNGTWLREKYA